MAFEKQIHVDLEKGSVDLVADKLTAPSTNQVVGNLLRRQERIASNQLEANSKNLIGVNIMAN